MSNYKKKSLLLTVLLLVFSLGIQAQRLSGHVYSSTGQPIVDAVISSPGCPTVRSAGDGSFTIEGVAKGNALTVLHDGYFQRVVYVSDTSCSDLGVYMMEVDKSRYNET